MLFEITNNVKELVDFTKKNVFLEMMSHYLLVVLVTFSHCLSIIFAETPANCTYEDVRGLWIFSEGPRRNDKTVNCSDNCTNSSC